VFLNWSPYVLLVSGAFAFFLVSKCVSRRVHSPLAARLTVVDPLVAASSASCSSGAAQPPPLGVAGEALRWGCWWRACWS